MINLVPETHTAPPAARRRYIWRSMGLVAAVMVAVLALVLLAPDGGFWRMLAALLAVAGLALGVYEFIVLMRALDELQQRIHMMALAIGCGGAVMIVSGLAVVSALMQWGSVQPALTVVIAVAGYYVSLFALTRRFS
jgi:Kef-type K+ transport system membrane component KefB